MGGGGGVWGVRYSYIYIFENDNFERKNHQRPNKHAKFPSMRVKHLIKINKIAGVIYGSFLWDSGVWLNNCFFSDLAFCIYFFIQAFRME